MTTEDKIYIGVGAAIIGVGGFMYYKNNQKTKNSEPKTIDVPFEDVSNETLDGRIKTPSSATPTIVNSPTQNQSENQPKLEKGQVVMAKLWNGTQTFEVKKDANGVYFSTGVKKAKFKFGDKIGRIIQTAQTSNGAWQYVVERKGAVLTSLHYVYGNNVSPVLPILTPKRVLNTKGLLVNRRLHKGMFNSKEVAELQNRLGLNPDGDFGKLTEDALMKFKKVKTIRLIDWI